MTTHCAPSDIAIGDQPTNATGRGGGDRCIERTVITSDGVEIAVRDHQPPTPADHTVVLLHGLCLTQTSWQNSIRHLQRRSHGNVRIISYDHRGHGRSTTAPSSTYTVDRLASDLAEVLTAVHVTGPTTIGAHSMGGMCALAYLARPVDQQPVQPAGLVLVATAAGRLVEHGFGRLLATPGLDTVIDLVDQAPHRAAECVVRALTRPVCAALTRHGGYGRIGRGTLVAAAVDAVYSTPWTTALGFLRALKTYDQRSTLHRITAATTVISGGADILTPPAHSRDLVAGIPNATHVHRPAAGHMLLHDAARIVTDAIITSIRSSSTHRCTTADAVSRSA
jgi:pimeloyl-ACP methyl ester carboxylesterase